MPSPEDPSRIFLIGFMCSGKTRVGRELSALLGRPFHDIDRVIEARTGPLVPWFQAHGEAAFRELEREVLSDLLQEEQVVIACGGGTPFSFDNMQRMQRTGAVVHLDVPLEVLVERCARYGTDRPLLFGLKGEALKERVATLLQGRLPIYRQAAYQVKGDRPPTEVAQGIATALGIQER
ncbi:MAG TPA: shikimate kinase [Flavobacteriales bacterium]